MPLPADRPSTVAAERRALWVAPLGVFLLALLVTALLVASVLRSIAAQDRAAFETEVVRTTDAVRERLDTLVTLLHGTAGLFAASDRVEREDFAAYVQQLQLRQRYPGVQGIGFTERIDPPRLAQRTAQLRATGLPGFRVWPAMPREVVHSIVYLEPLDARNRAALGYDMYTEPTRRAAMATARDRGVATASGKVVLLQEIDEEKQAGFLIYLPVYRGGGIPATVEARRERLLGFVYAPLRVGDLLKGVRGSGIPELDLALYDGVRPQAETLMLATAHAGDEPRFTARRTLEVAGRPWLLQFGSRAAFEQISQRRLVPWLVAVSFGASLLLAWITYMQARARRTAERAAAQRRLNELALQASEERARERAQRLQELYAELREGDRRKDEFLAVLAHELRNPLAPIRTALEILRRDPHGPAAVRARGIAERQVRHMVRLVDDLLDVSRISRGKIALQRERTTVAALVEAAAETSRPLVQTRRHQLHIAPIDPALALEVDPARVAQVLTNLLNNAANYTPEGGRIDVEVQADAREVRIAVRDSGIGLAQEQLARVFDLFVQIERNGGGQAASGGLGIGLSLSARLAELHGGRIEARSPGLGQGAEFVLVLPREAPAPTADGAPALAAGG